MDAEVAKFIAQAAISVGGAFLAAFLAGRRFNIRTGGYAYTDLSRSSLVTCSL
jgi:hypothetical protein